MVEKCNLNRISSMKEHIESTLNNREVAELIERLINDGILKNKYLTRIRFLDVKKKCIKFYKE